MTDRGLPLDGAPACPFVAFEDDRDARSTAPDHRHRCYAEARPAPRALAHQEAYCLASAFPVCPTFQDWARREAAAATPTAAAPTPAVRSDTEQLRERSLLPPPDRPDRHPDVPPLPPHRPAPRDWAAPPPWLSGDAPADAGFDAPGAPRGSGAPGDPAARGLSGSVADRWASRGPDDEDDADDAADPAAPPRRPARDDDTDLPGLLARSAGAGAGRGAPPPLADLDDDPGDEPEYRPISRRERLPAERPGRQPEREPRRDRPRAGADPARQRRNPDDRIHGPAWEEPRRFEAYPQIKSPVGLPNLSPLLLGIAALGLAAVALFFLPALLGVGNDDDPTGSPTASASTPTDPTPTPEPTPTPAPTPTIHVVAEGDTLSKIAAQYGLTLEDLLAANEQITNPNRISVGDEIIIPVAEPSPPDEVPSEESPSP